MRIFVRDYGVHPFPVQLSRELARRGHVVHHLYAPFFQSPKGGLVKTPDDPDGRTIEALDIGEPFHKYAFLPRLRQEIRYGHMAADRVRAFRPDVAIGCTIPLDPQNIYLRACRGIAPPTPTGCRISKARRFRGSCAESSRGSAISLAGATRRSNAG
ncbi:MAG: hypothetical protein VW547_07735 [Alphaproteobacteria bacterium]